MRGFRVRHHGGLWLMEGGGGDSHVPLLFGEAFFFGSVLVYGCFISTVR